MQENMPLYELIKLFRESEQKDYYFEMLFEKFEPLLNKYARLLGDADMKYYLAESIYNSLVKFPISVDHLQEDKFVISYIQKAIIAEYIKISKYNRKSQGVIGLDEAIDSNQHEKHFEEVDCKALLDEIYAILDKQEIKLFNLRFLYGYTDTELAKYYSITRQGLNKRIRKIQKKIKTQVIDNNNY